MKKQNSIDWLVEQLKKQGFLYDLDIEQAKKMHEMEIITAHFTAQPFSATMLHNAEKYYNETFREDAREQK